MRRRVRARRGRPGAAVLKTRVTRRDQSRGSHQRGGGQSSRRPIDRDAAGVLGSSPSVSSGRFAIPTSVGALAAGRRVDARRSSRGGADRGAPRSPGLASRSGSCASPRLHAGSIFFPDFAAWHTPRSSSISLLWGGTSARQRCHRQPARTRLEITARAQRYLSRDVNEGDERLNYRLGAVVIDGGSLCDR